MSELKEVPCFNGITMQTYFQHYVLVNKLIKMKGMHIQAEKKKFNILYTMPVFLTK